MFSSLVSLNLLRRRYGTGVLIKQIPAGDVSVLLFLSCGLQLCKIMEHRIFIFILFTFSLREDTHRKYTCLICALMQAISMFPFHVVHLNSVWHLITVMWMAALSLVPFFLQYKILYKIMCMIPLPFSHFSTFWIVFLWQIVPNRFLRSKT